MSVSGFPALREVHIWILASDIGQCHAKNRVISSESFFTTDTVFRSEIKKKIRKLPNISIVNISHILCLYKSDRVMNQSKRQIEPCDCSSQSIFVKTSCDRLGKSVFRITDIRSWRTVEVEGFVLCLLRHRSFELAYWSTCSLSFPIVVPLFRVKLCLDLWIKEQ